MKEMTNKAKLGWTVVMAVIIVIGCIGNLF